MNDTLREYLSYGTILKPMFTYEKTIDPFKIKWGGSSQYFLLFESPKPTDTLVIYIHGGGWNSNSPEFFSFIGQRIAEEGYDCVLPSYRKTPKADYRNIVFDTFAGYCSAKKYLALQGRSYSKVIVMGSSAGGHLGALLCYDSFLQKKFGIFPNEFSGFISLAGPLCFDKPHTLELNVLASMLFRSRNPDDWKKGEPIRKLKHGQTTPCFVVQSPHDGVVGYEQAKKFCEHAEELNITAEFYTVTEKQDTHSAYCTGIFLKDTEESPLLAAVLEKLDEYSR